MDPSEQLKKLGELPEELSFSNKINRRMQASAVDILQINLGKQCNLACKHCHVEAGPKRPEQMSRKTMEKCLEIARQWPISTIDITGGAPEMNPNLGWFIVEAAKLNRRLLLRSNLVILQEENYRPYIDLYAENRVELVGSLPAYNKEQADRQRGKGFFEQIIAVLKLLNGKGYGKPGSGLLLDLVYNPVGAYLPGSQEALEAEFKRRLSEEHGVLFNKLFTITNCPVGRFLEYLVRTENFDDYINSLIETFNPDAVDNVMCRNTVSVGWDGTLFDCDFNQMLELPVNHGAPDHISKFNYDILKRREIVINNHCYCCTAGAGSSCQGALE